MSLLDGSAAPLGAARHGRLTPEVLSAVVSTCRRRLARDRPLPRATPQPSALRRLGVVLRQILHVPNGRLEARLTAGDHGHEVVLAQGQPRRRRGSPRARARAWAWTWTRPGAPRRTPADADGRRPREDGRRVRRARGNAPLAPV